MLIQISVSEHGPICAPSLHGEKPSTIDRTFLHDPINFLLNKVLFYYSPGSMPFEHPGVFDSISDTTRFGNGLYQNNYSIYKTIWIQIRMQYAVQWLLVISCPEPTAR